MSQGLPRYLLRKVRFGRFKAVFSEQAVDLAPFTVLIGRNDIVYVDGAGVVWNNAAVGRTAVINTPGGGLSRATRRPDLVPGVDPFIQSGGLLFLNPAAFAIELMPAPQLKDRGPHSGGKTTLPSAALCP